MKNIRIVISIIAALIICGPSFSSSYPINSVPSRIALPQVPPQITANTTTLLFFVWGYLDAQDEIEEYDALTTPHYSFRLLAVSNRTAAVAVFFDIPEAFAYFWGKAEAFDHEADRRGEP